MAPGGGLGDCSQNGQHRDIIKLFETDSTTVPNLADAFTSPREHFSNIAIVVVLIQLCVLFANEHLDRVES
jgi:hypothetical protein